MSERGMILALQRIHDDPGFTDRVSEDPQNTLGLYDLDQEECDTLIQAVTNRDNRTIRKMASNVGIDWTADHIGGPGALDETEVSLEGAANLGIQGPGALPGDGYDGVMPGRAGV
jgi:hypothetical protein